MKRRYPVQAEPKPEKEPPREWTRQVQDDIREFGGKCSDACDHPKPKGLFSKRRGL